MKNKKCKQLSKFYENICKALQVLSRLERGHKTKDKRWKDGIFEMEIVEGGVSLCDNGGKMGGGR